MGNPMIGRRAWLASVAALGASACNASRPQEGFLGGMEKVSGGLEKLLFRSSSSSPRLARASETRLSDFPVYFVSRSIPLAPPGWTLRISGLVARPVELTLDDLKRMPRTDMRIEHHCVEGWSAVASWHGVRLRDLAARVGADRRVQFVEFRSFDNGYYSSWDRESAFHDQTMIAYGMDGALLTPDHGAPARLYGAVKLGYKNVKYLSEIRFLPDMTGGYWENQGYEWYAGV